MIMAKTYSTPPIIPWMFCTKTGTLSGFLFSSKQPYMCMGIDFGHMVIDSHMVIDTCAILKCHSLLSTLILYVCVYVCVRVFVCMCLGVYVL